MDSKDSLNYLVAHGIKPSVQRLAVMDYLMAHDTHPTVDEIYCALIDDIPTLSKATVYNTLKLLVEKGAASQLTIDERNACYDGQLHPHAHFLCKRCGKVFDLPLKQPQLTKETDIPTGFSVEDASLYFRGVCPNCQHTN